MGGPGGSDGVIPSFVTQTGPISSMRRTARSSRPMITITLVITGLSRDPRTGEELEIEVKNFTPGKKIIIDGETGLITEDGKVKIDDVEIWALPDLQPGKTQSRQIITGWK